MDRVRFNKPSDRCRNYHHNYLYPYEAKVKVLNPQSSDPFSRYNVTADNIQTKILQKAINENKRVHPYGSTWSLSETPYGKDYMIDNSSLTLVLPLINTDKHANNTDNIANFCFVQSGKKIKSITKYLAGRGKSLRTSGASNGQTIAGAISTGVHGSAIDFGSVQDFVAGLNIIVSETRSIYIERASRPVLNDNFAQKINSDIIRDDDLFNAALVGLGAFGFIHGVLIEVEDHYLLERHIVKLDRNDALDLAKSQNFTGTSVTLPNQGERPFHYKLYMNPFKHTDPFIAEILFKRPFAPHPSPIPTIRTTYYRDVPSLVSAVVSAISSSVPTFADVLSNVIFPSPNDPVKLGTLGEIFYNTTSRGAVYGLAVAVEVAQCERVLNAINTAMINPNVPGLLSMRFVKATKATLGFTRFAKTAIVEVDGVKWNKMDAFITKITNILSNSNLDFALHWGKNAAWSSALVDKMYGQRKNDWIAQRDSVITPQMRTVFAS